MTTLPHPRSLPTTGVTSAVARLRAGGHRVSAARRLALEALFAADGPVSAEELAGGLDGRLPSSDLASLYRNLDTLAAAGIVDLLEVPGRPRRYVPAGRGHGWAACERCGGVEQLGRHAAAQLREAVRAATAFEPRLVHYPLVGVCPACGAA